ncbi:MAG TPA: MBL fold metallo-hydrolase [Vicinamibacterales bacterium]|nr:MBL fold metallo-hydrolase [Vicinamibacterales bacterium]
MDRRIFVATLAVIALTGCSTTPSSPDQQFVDDVMRALGGRARIESGPRFLTIEGRGVQYNLGQDMKPEARTQTFEVTDYRRVIDVAQDRQRIEQTRTPRFAYFQGPQPQRQIQSLDGQVGFNVNASGRATRLAAASELERRIEFYHHPLTLAHALTVLDTRVTNVRTAGAARQADIAIGPVRVTLTIDPAGLPLSASSPSAHANLGDVMLTTTFARYQDIDGVKLPAQLAGKVDDFTVWELEVTKQAFGTEAADLAAPADVAAAPAATAAPNVTAEKIGSGVWLLAGQSHHSALVEFADHLMLIEAPHSEARTLAVIATAKATVPNKPLTQLVITHHHFDHTAGMRAAIAEGMTMITHAGNREWVEHMAKRPHTIAPDTLARNATRLVVDTVDDEKVFKDASQAATVYHVAGNPHSETMVMVYIPRDRLLVEVDAFSPTSAVHPYAANLLENIQRRKLQVDKIVPLHGVMAPLAELVKVSTAK